MYNYLQLIKEIQDNGYKKSDRTGTGTTSLFGKTLTFDLNDGMTFPLITTKKVWLKGVIHELLWFLKGDTNIKYLKDNGVHIWNEWADENGDLGDVYGKQWRNFNGVDQIQNVINTIKSNPSDRRMIVSAWNPEVLPDPSIAPKSNVEFGKAALPPCHYSFQFIVEDDQLSLLWNQRSVDTFLGLPFNIASYGFLLMMVARITGYKAHRLIFMGGDCHIYNNHEDQIKEQLSREVLLSPAVYVPVKSSIDDYTFDDFGIVGYHPHPTIQAPISV